MCPFDVALCGEVSFVEVYAILTITPAYSRGCGVPSLPLPYSRGHGVGGGGHIPCCLRTWECVRACVCVCLGVGATLN